MIHGERPAHVLLFPGDAAPGGPRWAWPWVPWVHSPAGLMREASALAQEPALQKSEKPLGPSLVGPVGSQAGPPPPPPLCHPRRVSSNTRGLEVTLRSTPSAGGRGRQGPGGGGCARAAVTQHTPGGFDRDALCRGSGGRGVHTGTERPTVQPAAVVLPA